MLIAWQHSDISRARMINSVELWVFLNRKPFCDGASSGTRREDVCQAWNTPPVVSKCLCTDSQIPLIKLHNNIQLGRDAFASPGWTAFMGVCRWQETKDILYFRKLLGFKWNLAAVLLLRKSTVKLITWRTQCRRYGSLCRGRRRSGKLLEAHTLDTPRL